MKNFQSTLDKLKRRAYWRVEFYPSVFTESAVDSLQAAKQIITDSSVQLRGWDFPHIPRKEDAKQSIYPIGDRLESWIDWSIHKEVWRFYRSGKFTHLAALYEQWYDEYEVLLAPSPLQNRDTSTYVDITSTIYKLTEFFLFFSNIADSLPAIDGFEARVTLHGAGGNELVVLEPSRSPLYGSHLNRNPDIVAAKTTLSRADLADKDTVLKSARDACQNVFEQFDWQASGGLLDADQAHLLSRRF